MLFHFLYHMVCDRSQFTIVQVSDKALNNDAIIRGAYINTGSKDIGPDPKAFTYNSKSSNS